MKSLVWGYLGFPSYIKLQVEKSGILHPKHVHDTNNQIIIGFDTFDINYSIRIFYIEFVIHVYYICICITFKEMYLIFKF